MTILGDRQEIANNKTQITDLQHRVKVLSLSSEGYHSRDILDDVDEKIGDASIYLSGERS
jgi:hypothetical protein